MQYQQKYQLFRISIHYQRGDRWSWTGNSFVLVLLALLLFGCGVRGSTEEEIRGQLTIAGATSLQPLIAEAAKLFQKEYPNVRIQLHSGGSLGGLEAMAQEQADIALSDMYADPALYPDPEMVDHLLCVVPFVMIVNPSVNISSLSQQHIIDIFSTGKYRNWKEVGGPDLAIVPVVRDTSSGTRVTFRRVVLGGSDESGHTTGTLVQQGSSLDVREMVAHTPGSIGYVALPFVNTSVRTVAINEYNAEKQEIDNGTYSFWSYGHLYTLKKDQPLVAAFLDFVFTSEVQNMLQKLNYIPL